MTNTNQLDTDAANDLRNFALANNEIQFAHLVTAALAGEQWAVDRVSAALELVACDRPSDALRIHAICSADTTRPDGATARGIEI